MFGLFEKNLFRIIGIGRAVSKVIDAIRSERKGETNFAEMSADIGEAVIEYFIDGGVTVVDDKFGYDEATRTDVNARLEKLVKEQAANPSIGKQSRIDQLREQNLES